MPPSQLRIAPQLSTYALKSISPKLLLKTFDLLTPKEFGASLVTLEQWVGWPNPWLPPTLQTNLRVD
jgi:hypothetical protein